MRTLSLLMILAGLPAMAADPGQETPAAPAEATAPASVPAPAATPVPVAAAAPIQAAAPAEEYKPPKGYKVKTREGQTVYCRSQTTVGTRFPTEYCFTQVDLERIEKNKRSIQLDHATRTKMCSTGAACGGG